MLEGRGGPTGTAVFYSALAESTPLPKGSQSRRWGGRLVGRQPARAGTASLLLVFVLTSVFAVISAQAGSPLPEGRV